MKQNIFLMITLVITLAGCGVKNTNPKIDSNSDELQSYINLDELKAALDKQVVICGEGGLACPGFAAKITFWGASSKNNYYLAVCSGSLYQNKYIITNSHCIPKEISRAGASCSDQLKVLFPTTKYYESESAKCKSIVQVYSPDKNQPDLAVIELDRVVNRDSVEIAKDGYIENSNVTAYTMNPDQHDNTLGVIVKKNCVLSTDNAIFMSTSHSAHSAIVSGMFCDVIHGNSGTALLNKNGKMIGAVFARMEPEQLTKVFSENHIHFTSSVPMGIAQNITCLNSVTSNSGIGCDMKALRVEDFNDFVTRSIQTQNLSAVSDGQIEYEVTAGFKLKLKEVGVATAPNDLQSFKDNWSKIFFQNASTSEASKILRMMAKRK
ncbi:MAG: trypsin-like serine protease [Rhizobacter sp.]|nr:trypsin-like serine protease [Bacteriovorax sp.]